ncbi:MAG TPA: hypothetical protein VK955_01595, partial [Xanthobacteraceae bacterium]|nr:hypothetical protein [Xanthobacteraceae bacterium]
MIKASSRYCFQRGDTLANRPPSEKRDRQMVGPPRVRDGKLRVCSVLEGEAVQVVHGFAEQHHVGIL